MYVLSTIDKGEPVDIVYLDFAKAFDTVPHKRLMVKVREHQIRGKVASWIEEWLKDRKQRVQLNGRRSEWECVLSGVPQGSVLGPLLFILYVNDLEVGVGSRVSKFADDTKIAESVCGVNGSIRLQHSLDHVVAWAEKWQMRFNVNKCKVMHVGSSNRLFEYDMNGVYLQSVEEEKDLGVTVSNTMKPSKYVCERVKIANARVNLIRRNLEFKSADVVCKLYNAQVRPILEYCVSFAYPYLQKDIDRLEQVQRRATRLIPALKHLDYKDRLAALNMYSLKRRRLRGDMIHVYKLLYSDDLNWKKFFRLSSDVSTAETRGHSLKLAKAQVRTQLYASSFSNRVVNYWNDLTESVVSAPSLETFKSRLDALFDERGIW